MTSSSSRLLAAENQSGRALVSQLVNSLQVDHLHLLSPHLLKVEIHTWTQLLFNPHIIIIFQVFLILFLLIFKLLDQRENMFNKKHEIQASFRAVSPFHVESEIGIFLNVLRREVAEKWSPLHFHCCFFMAVTMVMTCMRMVEEGVRSVTTQCPDSQRHKETQKKLEKHPIHERH